MNKKYVILLFIPLTITTCNGMNDGDTAPVPNNVDTSRVKKLWSDACNYTCSHGRNTYNLACRHKRIIFIIATVAVGFLVFCTSRYARKQIKNLFGFGDIEKENTQFKLTSNRPFENDS